ncbi:31110_t:CDS:2, partial [Gigaspora margarita]
LNYFILNNLFHSIFAGKKCREAGNTVLIELENLIKKKCIFAKDEVEKYEEFERYGGFERYGEKFIIFLIDIDLDIAHKIAEKIRSSVETHLINFYE